jgi:O-antigen/teichoic acid export membrane protein
MRDATQRPTFIRDLLGTAMTAGLSVIALLLTTRWLAIGLGPEEFGAVTAGRRLALFAAPLLTCSITISLTRTIAATHLQTPRPHQLLSASVRFVGLVLAATFAVTWIMRDTVARLVFSSDARVDLLMASLSYLAMMTTHAVWVAYLRGTGAVQQANLWTIGVMAVQVGLAWGSQTWSAADYLRWSSLLAIPHCLAIGLVIASNRATTPPPCWWTTIRPMIRFGWLRAPSTLLLDSVALLTQVLVTHLHGFAATVPFAIAYMLMRLADGILNPLSITLLSRTHDVLAQMSSTHWRQRLVAAIEALTDLPLFLTLQTIVWLPLLLEIWLGSTYVDNASLCQWLLVAGVPYAWILFSRGLLDTIDPYPWATRYLGLASLITGFVSAALIWVLPALQVIAAASTILFTLYGLFLWHHLYRRFAIPSMTARISHIGLINLVLMGVAALIALSVKQMPLPLRLATAGLTTATLAIGYLRWGLPVGTIWVQHVHATICSRRTR